MVALGEHPELLGGVDELRARVYPDHPEARDRERHAAVWRWLGRQPLVGDMHRWVAATETGEVVGHLAALPVLFGRGPDPEVLDEFDDSFDGLFERVAARIPCAPERDAAFLRWRYGTGSPPYPVTVLGVREGGAPSGDLLGYAVLRLGEDGDNGYVLDLTARPDRDDVAWSLLRESVGYFARAGAYIVRYRFAPSPASPQPHDLRGLGFFPRPGRAHTLLVRFADRGLHKTALDAANWSYTTGDGEAGFWVS